MKTAHTHVIPLKHTPHGPAACGLSVTQACLPAPGQGFGMTRTLSKWQPMDGHHGSLRPALRTQVNRVRRILALGNLKRKNSRVPEPLEQQPRGRWWVVEAQKSRKLQ